MKMKYLILLCYVITKCQIGETGRRSYDDIQKEIRGIWAYVEVKEDGVGKDYTTVASLLPEINKPQRDMAIDWLNENKEPDVAENEQYRISYRRFSKLMKYLMSYPDLKHVHRRLKKASKASSSNPEPE